MKRGNEVRMGLRWVLGILVLVTAAGALRAAEGSDEAADPHLSVFVDDAAFGKDPFFPTSQRRRPVEVVPVDPTNLAPTIEGLELKGLSGADGERLAIINNRTFAVGEERAVRVKDVRVTVRCEEIRDNSVVISVQGVRRELKLRGKL